MEMVSKAACLIVLCLVQVIAPHAEATVTCGQVVSLMTPCIPYLRTGGPVPTPCCNGAKALNSAASNTPDRQAACRCLVTASKSISGINFGNANKLPGLCGINFPYQISPSTDCSKVK